ncbi:MAG: hypothetical protein WAV28_05430 [Sedimentisphaerales bacterium]
MNEDISDNNPDHPAVPQPRRDRQDSSLMREYRPAGELINNVPYLVMIMLGTVIFIAILGVSAWGLLAAAAYLTYGLMGAFWIMIFVCPYCRYWNTKSCPCGYGRIASKFRKKKPIERFSEKFKKHIPVIMPLWFIPVLVGVPLVIRSFSWTLLVLLVVFALEAFVILPLVSTKHGCKGCPQKDLCPWMKNKCETAA